MLRFAGVPACALALLAGGCGLMLEPDGPTRSDGGVSDTGTGGNDSGIDAPGLDGGPSDGGPDVWAGECRTATDCTEPPPVCDMGAWECVAGTCVPLCPGCTDLDRDGYGAEPAPACVGGDCNDADPTVFDTAMAACYTGPSGTVGVGVCRGGEQTCTDGRWSACFGELRPSGETCNAADDDCDGSVDDDLGTSSCGVGACARRTSVCAGGVLATCVPGTLGGTAPPDVCDGIDNDCDGAIDEDCTCLAVTAGSAGSDVTGNGTRAYPYATINRALMRIATDPAAPRVICVAQGANCSGTLTYRENVSVPNGVFINGAYESTTWTRCPVGPGAPPRTVIGNLRSEGVIFDPAVTSATGIDGFRIDRATTSPAAGISINASRHVTISNVAITDQPAVEVSYGIVMTDGAQAVIYRSWIFGGAGSRESIGIKSVAALPVILDSCNDFSATGLCDQDCYDTSHRGIGGRIPPAGAAATAVGAGSESYGILLEDSPDAMIDRTALCAGHGATAAAVRVRGQAHGTIFARDKISGYGGSGTSWGMRFDACAGDAPLVTRNRQISVEHWMSTTTTAAISASGDCDPAIQDNELIVGDLEGAIANALAIECTSDRVDASQCSIEDNDHILGTSPFAVPRSTTAIRCSDGGCGRIVGNPDIAGRNAVTVIGLHLQRSSPLVARNHIVGGCTDTGAASGIRADDAGARIENNVVISGFCGDIPFSGLTYTALRVTTNATSGRELDVNGNAILTQGRFMGCTGTALELGGATTGLTGAIPLGIYRNNIFRGGNCPTDRLVVEVTANDDPRELSFSLFDNTTAGLDVYYLDEGAMMIAPGAIAGVAPSSLVGNPLWRAAAGGWASGLVDPASPTNGAGTAMGAPALDIEGNPRDLSSPDIGADEN